MKLFAALTASVFAVTSFTQPVLGQGTRITTEAEFGKSIVGKRLNFGKDWVTIQRNGKLRGNFGGNATRGVWEWRDGFWCRTLTKPRQNTDCQTWEAVDGGFKVTRDRGKGRSFTYTLK